MCSSFGRRCVLCCMGPYVSSSTMRLSMIRVRRSRSLYIIYSTAKLLPLLNHYKVTNMLFTPSLLELMASQGGFTEAMQTMRFLVLCGEVVSAATYRAFDKHLLPLCKVYNSYSISETFDVAGCCIPRHMDSVTDTLSVGPSLPHAKVFILDDMQQLCPKGVDGNVFVAAHSLARGYVDLDDLTKAKFVDVPSHLKDLLPKGFPDRMYNCGDTGFWEGDHLRVGGRSDSMIKIRGYSVELGAITSAIDDVSIIKECVVIADGDKAATNKILVAYIVLDPNQESEHPGLQKDFSSLRRYLIEECRRVIPAYSIPSVFVKLDALPISETSGKLDRKLLPCWKAKMAEQMAMVRERQSMTATSMEKKVLDVVRNVLNVDLDIIVEPRDSFFEVGGHSLSATLYLDKLRQDVLPRDVQSKLTLDDVFKYPMVANMAKYLLRITGEEEVEIEDECPNLKQIVDVLVRDLKPLDQVRGFWRALENEQKWGNTRVLLTGATGWLGSHILAYMLEETDYLVTVIVRDHGSTGEELLREVLQNYKLTSVEGALSRRVRVLVGDLSRFDLGLGHEMYRELTTRIDCVVHAAANVNLMLPYSSLRSANVDGTRNILEFCTTGHIKQLHYVSTNGVIPAEFSQRVGSVIPELDELLLDSSSACADLLPCGYYQTKWIAEQVVRCYQRNGLPCTIYRVGNIGGNNATGMWNPKDSNLAFFRICYEIGAIPTEVDRCPTNLPQDPAERYLRMDNDSAPTSRRPSQSFPEGIESTLTMEMTPVNFIAKCICEAIPNIRAISGRTVHLIQSKRTRLDHILTAFEHLNLLLKRVTPARWNTLLKEANITDPTLLRQFNLYLNNEEALLEMFGRHVPCEAQNFKLILGEDVVYPSYSTPELTRAFRGITLHKLVPVLVGRPRHLPLLNRLIVVTGASSGIGRAVCQDLVEKGANLIMVARRKGHLEELKKFLLDQVPEGIPEIPKLFVCCADVTNTDQLTSGVERCELEANDKVWGLVHCAGVMHYMKISNFEVDVWHKEIDVNCKGTVNAIRAVLPSMKLCDRGHIVCISSDAGKKAFDGLAVYSGTKAFVEFFCEALRREVCPDIKVTTIAPGDVKTELLWHNKDPEALSAYGAGPGAEMLEPSDIAEAIGFAMTRKDHSSVNSIIIEPREAPI
eukprot:GHVH01015008.1.p1 GENE.GHVH01015008.1~~GHVH01015008.1.p1  ORF type:complete len:1158 (-),score=184.83 GHVH01015008.1:1358-4831(-)